MSKFVKIGNRLINLDMIVHGNAQDGSVAMDDDDQMAHFPPIVWLMMADRQHLTLSGEDAMEFARLISMPLEDGRPTGEEV